jgi:hypothetical protein
MVKYRLGYTWDEYRKKIESGEWQLHQFPKGFVITEGVKFAEETVLTVHLAGGEQLDAWKTEANETLKQFGREQGCQALEAVCRIGLAAKLKPLGWRHYRTVMRLEL